MVASPLPNGMFPASTTVLSLRLLTPTLKRPPTTLPNVPKPLSTGSTVSSSTKELVLKVLPPLLL